MRRGDIRYKVESYQSTTEAKMIKAIAVSETSRAKWWEWFVVGVLFATAVVCAHIAR